MSSAHDVRQVTFMEGDFSVGLDILDPYDPTTKLLGSLARSQYPYTLYPIHTTAATDTTTMAPSAFSPTSVKVTTALASHHPWSDMVFGDMCSMDLSPGISSSLSTTSSSTRSSSTSCSSLPFSSCCPLSPTFQTSSDFDASYSSSSTRTSPFAPCTHEHSVFDIPTPKKKNDSEYISPFDGDLRPRHDSLLDITMTLDDLDHAFDEQLGEHEYETDHESDQDMDLDSNGSLNDNEATSSKSSPFSRDSSTTSDVTERKPPSSSGSPEPKTTSSNSDEQAPPSSTKSKTKAKSKVKSTRTTPSTTTTLGRPTKAARKQSGAEQLSAEAKRQRFLERNRLAAAKCREKKRLQTLKTITNADEITAKNQALHESLEELQEEVRKLKNQILCHRDCGCDVIQKFVKTSLVPSSSSRKMSLGWNPPFSPPYFHDG